MITPQCIYYQFIERVLLQNKRTQIYLPSAHEAKGWVPLEILFTHSDKSEQDDNLFPDIQIAVVLVILLLLICPYYLIIKDKTLA